MTRHDGRAPDALRPISIRRGFLASSVRNVLMQAGNTVVLCTASISNRLPEWLEGKGKGWITAEYGMLPGSTSPRKPRERGASIDGRTQEIQRLVGRSLRAVTNLEALGERLVTIDCDVLQADGGTRTLSITGALIALVDALHELGPWPVYPIHDSVAAVSVGLVDELAVLDLDYHEDAAASVDMNVVMTGSGRFVEVQGSGEEATFDQSQLLAMLELARRGVSRLKQAQREALGERWPWNIS